MRNRDDGRDRGILRAFKIESKIEKERKRERENLIRFCFWFWFFFEVGKVF